MTTYEQALKFMEATPTYLRTIVAAASPEALTWKPSDQAWSPHEVLAHLLRVETAVIGERIGQMIQEENPTFGAVPESTLPESPRLILDAWIEARTQNLAFLRTLTPEQIQRTGRHPRYGLISVREHIVEWAYHDLDHLRQIFAALQSGLYPEIGAFQDLYPEPS